MAQVFAFHMPAGLISPPATPPAIACAVLAFMLMGTGAHADEEFCATPGTLQTCPKTCAVHCVQGSPLAEQNPKGCANATLIAKYASAEDDPAFCTPTPPQAVKSPLPNPETPAAGGPDGQALEIPSAPEVPVRQTKLDACIAKAESAQRPTSGKPEVDAFLSDFPKCAPTIWALEDMYGCLQAQTAEMQKLYEQLSNYGLSKIAPNDRKQLCDRDDADLQTAEGVANRLDGLSVNTKNGFDKVSNCRSQIQTWLDNSIEGCGEDVVCKQEREALIAEVRAQLEPAREQQLEVETIVGKVRGDLGKIMSVLRLRSLLCRPRT